MTDTNTTNSPVRKTSIAWLVIAWLIVGVPAVWGISQTVIQSTTLFKAPPATAPSTAPATIPTMMH